MTIITSIQKVGESVQQTTEIALFDRTNLLLVADSSTVEGKEIVRRNEYVLAEGDDAFPMTARSEIRLNPNGLNGVGSTGISIRLSTRVTKIDDTNGEVLFDEPISAVLALTVPGTEGLHNVADAMMLLEAVFSLSYKGVTTTLLRPKTVVLDKFSYGAPDIS